MEVTLTKKKLCLILTSVGILVACFLAGKASNGPRKNSLSHEFVVPSKVYLERVNETCQTDVKCQAGVMNRELFKYLSFFLRGTPYPGVFNYTNYMVAYHEMKPLEGVEPLLPGFTPVLNDVTYFQYVSEVTCTAATDDVSTVFIAINSAPGNVLRRQAIRETWLKTLNDGKLIRGSGDRVIQVAGFAFFIGNSTPKTDLTEEREQFKDILQIDMLDTYYNISIKVAGLLNWIDTRCRGVDFVLKTDDDMYVNMINLANFLHPIDKKDVRLYGKLTHGTVQRETKWKMTFEEYPWREYPNYYAGPAFVISGTAVRPLLAAAQTIPYHPFDDLYLTGFCAERADVTIYNVVKLYQGGFEGERPSTCFVRDSVAWLLDGEEKMKSSHEETVKYYNNITSCIPDGSKVPLEGVADFTLERLNHLRS